MTILRKITPAEGAVLRPHVPAGWCVTGANDELGVFMLTGPKGMSMHITFDEALTDKRHHHKGQTHKHSFLEAWVNVGIGFFVSVLGQLFIFPLVGIQASWTQNMGVAVLFTILSIIRQYAVRRWFNRLMVRMHLR